MSSIIFSIQVIIFWMHLRMSKFHALNSNLKVIRLWLGSTTEGAKSYFSNIFKPNYPYLSYDG